MSNYVNDLDEILEDVGTLFLLLTVQYPSLSTSATALVAKINAFKYNYNGRIVSDIIYDPSNPTAVNYDKLNVIEDLS